MPVKEYKGAFKLLFEAGKGNIWLFSQAVLFTILAACFTFLRPQIIRITVDHVIGTEPVEVGSLADWIINLAGGREYLVKNIIICGVLILIVSALACICNFVYRYSTGKTAEDTVRNLRNRLYSHIQKLPYSWHTNIQTGDIIQRCTSDVDTIRGFIANQVMELVRTIFLAVASFIIMLSMNVRLTIAAAVFLPAIAAYSAVYFFYVSKRFKEADEAEGLLSAIAQENLSGVRVIRAFGREKNEIDRFNKQNDHYSNLWIKLGDMLSVYWGLGDMVTGLQVVVISIFGVLEAVAGNLTLGTFIAFIFYHSMLIWPLRGMGRILSELSKTRVSLSRLKAIFDAEPETEPENAKTPPIDREIVFDKVSFAFEKGNPVLDKVSFSIPAGTTLGILGETGSGKSTLAHLLCRLYELDEGDGRITIGGIDIKEINRRYLRANVGMVLQEPFLFSRSVKENIGAFNRDADLVEICRCARIACIDDSIQCFTKGYDTIVGERGITLSGGQKQRVAIARMLAQDSPVMIFDDSLSAVDTETDQNIRHELNRNLSNKTVLIISHRISTIMNADKIIVLSNGRIVEQGSHDELLENSGVYRRIFDLQTNMDDNDRTGDMCERF